MVNAGNEDSVKISRFEDLRIWQAGVALSKEVYLLSKEVPLRKEWSLNDQMKRAAISIPSNIAEGFERGSPGDFKRFLLIAKGSCGELRTQLHLASELSFIEKKEI